VGDAFEEGGLVEQRADVGPGPAAREHLRPLGHGVGHMGLDRRELRRGDQGAEVGRVVVGPSEPQRPRRPHEFVTEGVVDRLVDVDAFDVDTHLPCVREGGDGGAGRRRGDVGVRAHDERVLPAEFEGAADQPPGGAFGDGASGGRRAGEADEVGGVDDGAAHHSAVPGHDPPQVGGQTRPRHQLPSPQQGQRGLGIRLGDDGVAGQQRGKYVPDTEVEGIVPRGDDTDQPLGHPHLPDLRQAGHHAPHLTRGQVLAGSAGVVPGDRGDLSHLLPGMEPRLAGLPLDQVEDLVLPSQQQVVEGEHDLAPAPDRRPCPCGLGVPGRRGRGDDVLRVAYGHGCDR
jgi:hypothetical protein